MPVIDEGGLRTLKPASALHPDRIRPVAHHLGNGVVGEQGVKRPKSKNVVVDRLTKGLVLSLRKRQTLIGEHPV